MKRKPLECHDCGDTRLISFSERRDKHDPPELCDGCFAARQIDHDREEWKEREIWERMGEW